MVDTIVHVLITLPLWETIRYSGVLSFVMITIGLCLGVLYGMQHNKNTKLKLYNTHSFFTIGGTAIGILHGVITVIDTYTPYSWSDVLLPFTADFKAFLSGLGTLAAYILLFVILTTDLRNKINRKVWLSLHLLSYPAYFMTLIHGFFMGTDSKEPWMQWVYALSIGCVVLTVLYRGAFGKTKVTRA